MPRNFVVLLPYFQNHVMKGIGSTSALDRTRAASAAISVRLDWNASVRLLTSVIVQSNDLDSLTSVQAVVRWLVDSSTNCYLVFNRQSGAGFERPDTRLTAKFQKTFDF